MGQPFIGEIRMFGGSFAPAGWAFCAGQLQPISENDALFNLIGTTYGGDGQSTFGLPDLRGRAPMHQGSGFVIGQMAGSEAITLNVQQIPPHNHLVAASTNPGANATGTAVGNLVANESATQPDPAVFAYAPFAADGNQRALNSASIAPAGGSQPHDNMVPFLAVSFIISLFGIFPSQS
jgi:microcystin-dependent protein